MPQPNKYKFTIRGVDSTSYVVNSVIRKSKQPVKTCELLLNPSISGVVTMNDTLIGKEVLVQRGFDTSTERYIFRGEIISFRKNGSLYELFCACKMNRANRLEIDYVYDSEIDPEGGVGSEIVKSLFLNAGLNYNSTTVPSTGVTSEFILKVYKASGSILKVLNDLASAYGRVFYYRDSDDLAYFVEPGFNPTDIVIQTGDNVAGRITWTDTGEDIINNMTVVGGKQVDWTVESFTGDFDDVTLTATPIDTEITSGSTQLQRGVNNTDPRDFYTDSVNKKIIFTTTTNNPVVRYSYSVPIKVNFADTTSITNTYRVDRTILDTKLTNTDDAQIYAKSNVENNKNVLNSAPVKVIKNNNIEVGDEVRIIDNINNLDLMLHVDGITKHYPYKADDVNVGLNPYDVIDRDRKIIERLVELERQSSDTGDVTVSLMLMNDANTEVGTYIKLEKATMDADTLYWDSDTQGDWGNDDGTTGFNWGTDTEETYSEVYKESGFDD